MSGTKQDKSILVSNHIEPLMVDEFMNFLRKCLILNFCKFGGKFRKFSDRIPIGSPLSSLISEVFMDRLVGWDARLQNRHIGYCHHYVDNICCLWDGDGAQLDEFVASSDSCYPSIKFTVEYGGDSINFLDIRISIKNGRHAFGIFRKSICTDITVHGSSFCLLNHKHAAFHAVIHRLISIPLSPAGFHEEEDTIKYLVRKNRIHLDLSLIHIWRCRRSTLCRSRWSPYH